MSTTAITTTMATPNSNQIAVYGQPSPNHSANNTNTNNSPTSPRLITAALHQLPLQSRQLRPPKSPLYVPAALRPTERPCKPSTITPPRSVHGSLDSLDETDPTAPIARQPTGDSIQSGVSKLAEDAWMKTEQLGEVTGAPTRDHWKADSLAESCDSPICRSSFGMFLRRHHCRHCGHVFCASHTPYTVPLDQNARFHPDGIPSRACDLCWSAYQRWEKTRRTRVNRIQNLIDNKKTIGDTIQDPDARLSVALSNSDDSNNDSQDSASSSASKPTPEAIASSHPRDWNWSTF